MPLYFHNEDREHFISDPDSCATWLEDVIKKEESALNELKYIFCSDEYLLEINKSYLQHDYYTDVITFDNSGNSDEIIGDIFYSRVQTANSLKPQDFDYFACLGLISMFCVNIVMLLYY